MNLKRLRFFAVLLPMVFACSVHAQVAQSATVSLVAPTKNLDGSTITGTLTYNYFEGIQGGTFSKIFAGVTPTSETVIDLTKGRCFYATAIVAGVESGPSNTACLPPVPGSPIVTVTITTTVTQ